MQKNLKILKNSTCYLLLLLTSCSSTYVNREHRYTVVLPEGWRIASKEDDVSPGIGIPLAISTFVNFDAVDMVMIRIAANNAALMYFLSYGTFINLTNLYKSEDAEVQLASEIKNKYGNAVLLDKKLFMLGKVKVAAFYYQFVFMQNTYVYSINVLSGSISSTQVLYAVYPLSETTEFSQVLVSVISSYKKF